MNPPPDKKRKTGKGGWERGAGTSKEDDNPWGDDYTEDELEYMFSQAEPDVQEPPSITAAHSGSSRQESSKKQQPLASTLAPSSVLRPLTTSTSTRKAGAGDPQDTPTSAFSEDVKKQLTKSQKDLEDKNEELNTLKDDLMAKEGEISMQKETIKRKEAEIIKMKKERMKQLDLERQERSAKERELKSEVERLKGQMQFKEQEVVELQNRCRGLETQISRLDGSAASTSRLSTQSPRIHPVERRSPKKSPQTKYPTMETFRASMSSKSTKTQSTNTAPFKFVAGSSIRKRLPLKTAGGNLSGRDFVCGLLTSETSVQREITSLPPGIVRLLQNLPPPSVNLSSIYLERDSCSLLFSPRNKKGATPQTLTCSSQTGGPGEGNSLTTGEQHVTPESMALATRGLRGLLNCDRESTRTPPNSHSAILLLPLINDYLFNYLNMLSTTLETSNLSSPNSSFRTSNTSSSESSSYNSITSSLNLRLQGGAAYANNLEDLTIASLKVLHKLCDRYAEVCHFILSCKSEISHNAPSSGSAASNGAVIQPTEQVQTEGMQQGSPTSSNSSSSQSSIEGPVSEVQILSKLLRLADPGNGMGRPHNHTVVTLSLSILHSICQTSEIEQLECMSPLVTTGVLNNCLSSESPSSIVLTGSRLLSELTRCETISTLFCTAPDGCLLSCIYNLCNPKLVIPWSRRFIIYEQVINCLSQLIASRKDGCFILLDSRCHCYSECIRSITAMLHAVFKAYTAHRPSVSSSFTADNLQDLLRRGITLLHSIYQYDPVTFSDLHDDIEHRYISLICGMTSLQEHSTTVQDHEKNALHDLWDFDFDDWEFSQEDEAEEASMEVE